MIWFLIGLVREGAPSVCYWVVPINRGRGQEILAVGSHGDANCWEPEWNRSEDYLELLENESHAKQECTSGLIALDVRPASAGMGWRSIHNGVYVLRENRF